MSRAFSTQLDRSALVRQGRLDRTSRIQIVLRGLIGKVGKLENALLIALGANSTKPVNLPLF